MAGTAGILPLKYGNAVSHILELVGELPPLLVLEFVKEPTKATRYIRIVSIASAGLNETLWAMRVGKSREQEHHR